jgi:hypothetical protein
MNFLKKINLKENQRTFHLVLNATFSYIVVKHFIWCWTLLSVISWSNISFGVERHFQLYRGQTFHLVLNATFSYIVVDYPFGIVKLFFCVIGFQDKIK